MLGFALLFIGFSPVSGAIDTAYILSLLARDSWSEKISQFHGEACLAQLRGPELGPCVATHDLRHVW